ncbi:MAG: Uma2 family endonuclease [Pirellulales bacterium]
MVSTELITTAEQLLSATGLGRCELVRGELVMMTPAGFEHGRIAATIAAALVVFVGEQHSGVVTGAETGFQIGRDPDTVRAPDVAFVRAERMPAVPVRGYFRGAPDLAIEIVSPNDRAGEVVDKVRDWLAVGCQAAWVVDPQSRTVSIYRGPSEAIVLSESDALIGGDLLPGFCLPVAKIFAV